MTLVAATQVIRHLLEEIETLDTDETARRKFRRLVSDICLSHGINDIDRFERVYFARRMLDAKISRSTIRDRLIARFNISRSQAYRVIEQALKLSHGAKKNGTGMVSNVPTDTL